MSEYDDDIQLWSERQIALLRRLAAGERVAYQIDWENIIDELERAARERLHAGTSLLTRALVLQLKASAWPGSGAAALWEAEARRLRDDAAEQFTPSMRQRIDLARLYRRAFREVVITDGRPPLPMPETCPVTLDELLSEPADPGDAGSSAGRPEPPPRVPVDPARLLKEPAEPEPAPPKKPAIVTSRKPRSRR